MRTTAVAAAFCVFFSLISAYPTAANAGPEEGPPAGERPPLKPGKVIKEALFGIGAGFIGMMVGGFVGVGISGGEAGWFEPDTTVGAAAATGYFVALPWGVYLAGSDATQSGSLLATYLGAAAGSVIAIAVPSFGTALLAPAAGACIGFNLTRRYRTATQTGTALLNYKDGRMDFGFPLLIAAPDSKKKGSVRWSVNLVSIEL